MNDAHLAAYIEELHEFSASHGVPCEAPDGLHELVAALEARGTFFDECASMLRSVMYRERGEADGGSLLMLLTSAWGGLSERDQETALPLRQFVCGAMRAPQIGDGEHINKDVPVAASTREQDTEITPGEANQAVSVARESSVAAVILPENGCAGEGAQPALSEIESAMRELETRSPEVRLYRELLNQRETRQDGRVRLGAAPGAGLTGPHADSGELPTAAAAAESQAAFANGFDPWDESSDLQKELRRFARHRERLLAREAERALRPLHAKLLGGAESALVQLLGRDNPLRRALGLRSH